MMQLLPIEPFFEQVIAIERSAHTHPWSVNLLTKASGKFDCHRALVKDNQVIGYFYAQCIAGEASLLNIAIASKFQKQGFGKKLMQYFLDEMKAREATEAWLEVRESNLNAISLYESIGFNQFDRRYGYYPTHNGKEDALVMSYWFD